MLPAPQDAAEIDIIIRALLESTDQVVIELLDGSQGRRKELVGRLDQCVTRALSKIGEEYRQGKLEVYEVRAAVRTTLRILDELRQRLPAATKTAPVAVGGAMEGNFDEVGSRLVELSMRFLPMQSYCMGASLPASSLANAARNKGATIVWVSHTHVASTDRLLAWHGKLRSELPPGVRVIVGGGGLSQSLISSLQVDAYYESLTTMMIAERKRLRAKPSYDDTKAKPHWI